MNRSFFPKEGEIKYNYNLVSKKINCAACNCNCVVFQIETSDPSELNEEFLQDQLHPRKDLIRQKFAKPPKPAGSRGPRRIHNPQGEGASGN